MIDESRPILVVRRSLDIVLVSEIVQFVEVQLNTIDEDTTCKIHHTTIFLANFMRINSLRITKMDV